MEIQDDQLFCDCYGKQVIVNRYENYQIFINHCAKVLGIENILNKIQYTSSSQVNKDSSSSPLYCIGKVPLPL